MLALRMERSDDSLDDLHGRCFLRMKSYGATPSGPLGASNDLAFCDGDYLGSPV